MNLQPKVTRHGNSLDWVRISLAVARDGSIDPTDKALYAAIASYVDDETRQSPQEVRGSRGTPPPDVPTRQRLAECIGRTVFTVDRATKRLELRGLIRVRRQTDPGNPKVHVPSEYTLLDYAPAAAASAGKSSRRKTSGRTPGRPTVSPKVRLSVFTRDGHRCVKCGALDDLTIDHVIPWSRGGTNAMENLRTLCRPCNSRKGDREIGAEALS